MTTQNFFILTPAQAGAALGLDSAEYPVAPRAVDNASPGVGINLNDEAEGCGAGAAVPLTGKEVLPKRVTDDPNQTQALKGFLAALPFALLEAETIFAPAGDG